MKWIMSRVTLLLVIFCLMVNVAYTQQLEPSPIPPDYLRNEQNHVFFSEGLYSYFELTRPASDFAAVIFNVTQPGWLGSTRIIYDIDDIATSQDTFTQVSHLWQVPLDNPPTLFRGLTLQWDFIDIYGETESWSEILLYADPRTAWRTDSPGSVKVPLAIPSRALDVDRIRASVIDVYDLMAVQTGQQPELQYVFYDSSVPVSPCITDENGNSVLRVPVVGVDFIPCDPERAQQIYIANGYTPIVLAQLNDERILDAVTLDMFNVFFRNQIANNGSDIPAWFLDGYARFYSPSDSFQLLETSRSAERINRNYDQMPESPVEGQSEIWQAQAYGMVLYMADQIGIENLFQLGQRVLNGEALDSVYEELSGQSFESVIPNWRNWIYKQSTEGDYIYNPYISATLTPTATASNTLLPPTATQTSTVTLTPSRTPTLTTTPSPTQTPTVTNTPVFTVTFTATPVPAATPQIEVVTPEQERASNRQIIITSLIAAGAILIFGMIIAVIMVIARRSRGNE